MFNLGIYVGRLTADPELRTTTTNGVSVCNFTVACDRKFKKEGYPSADFIKVVTWSKLADNCGKYLAKGKMVLVVGENQTRSWEDNDGKKHYVPELNADTVRFLTPKDKNDDTQSLGDDTQLLGDEDLPF